MFASFLQESKHHVKLVSLGFRQTIHTKKNKYLGQFDWLYWVHLIITFEVFRLPIRLWKGHRCYNSLQLLLLQNYHLHRQHPCWTPSPQCCIVRWTYSQDLPGIWAHWSRFLCTFCSCSSLNRLSNRLRRISQIGTFQPPCFWKPEKEEVIVCYIWRSLPSSPCWSAWWARTLLHTLLGTPWLFHQGRSWDGTGASWGTLCRLDFRRNHIFRCWDCRTSNQRREAGLARLQPHLPSDKPNPLLP